MGIVVPWERPEGWQARPLEPDGPRGVILLFTGVRYERHGAQPAREVSDQASGAESRRSNRQGPRGRRRRV